MPTPTSILLAAAALVPVLAAKGTVIEEVEMRPFSFLLRGRNKTGWRIAVGVTFEDVNGTIRATVDYQATKTMRTTHGVGDDHTAAVLAAIK